MDIVLLIIALSISTYIVSSIYYTYRKQEILPNLIVLCYLWQIIGIVAAYAFYYTSLYNMLGFPRWLNLFFFLILAISTGAFLLFMKRNGCGRRTVLKTVFLSGCVFLILYGVFSGLVSIVAAIYFNILIYAVSTVILYRNRDPRQSNICFAQLSVAIIAFAVSYALKGVFSEIYVVGISSGAIFLISLASMLYYLEYTTLHLHDSNRLLQGERDISDQLRRKFEIALEVTHEGIWEYDFETDSVFMSKSLQSILPAELAPGKSPFAYLVELLHPEDRSRMLADIGGGNPESLKSFWSSGKVSVMQREIRMYSPSESRYTWHRMKTTCVKDPETGELKLYGALAAIQDVKDAEERIYRLAYYDTLTGLQNRTSFLEYLEHRTHPAVVFVVDLDRFEYINDSRGHRFGDAVIRTVSARLDSLSELRCRIYRIGVTQFAAVVDFKRQPELSDRLSRIFEQPVEISETKIHLTASIGYSYYDPRFCNVERLLIQLDLARKAARDKGGNCEIPFSEALYENVQEDVAISESLRDSIQAGEFFFHYQPQVDMVSRAVLGYEALLRWRKNGQMIPPDRIVRIAEETGQIYSLGLMIIESVFRDRGFADAGQTISINLSAMQLEQIEFMDDLKAMAEKHRIDPRQFVFEITEGVLLQGYEETLEKLEQMHRMGFRIALDDFGAGYASYSYLTKLPIDEMKLDRMLVQEALESERNSEIVRHMVQIGKSLGLRVVCEGIETEGQYQTLKGFNCDVGQGYFFSKPMPMEHFIKK